MIKCPTGAIRIAHGKASIRNEWCVDCAECMSACPVNAISVVQDDFQQIFDYQYRVVLLPAIFTGQFSKQISEPTILDALKELGFTHIFQVEQLVPLVHEQMTEMLAQFSEKPMISAFCPAIVRLIQVRFPSLASQICTIKPPIDASALFIRQQLENQGVASNNIGIFYITPCAAKIAAVKSPVGNYESAVNGVINMDFLYNKVYQFVNHKRSHQPDQIHETSLTAQAMQWSLSHGEASQMEGRCLAIDEIHNVIEFLERFETTNDIQNVDFLELRACDQSCAGGILTSANRFLTTDRLRKRATNAPYIPLIYRTNCKNEIDFVKQHIDFTTLTPRPLPPLGDNIGESIRKMQQIQNTLSELPGIDCGACGAPNCAALAEDIARNTAQAADCIFVQQTQSQKHESSINQQIVNIEKIWGKNRLNKNSNTKGA
jgi:Fe-S-cluster-containing hydrogenase component 2